MSLRRYADERAQAPGLVEKLARGMCALARVDSCD